MQERGFLGKQPRDGIRERVETLCGSREGRLGEFTSERAQIVGCGDEELQLGRGVVAAPKVGRGELRMAADREQAVGEPVRDGVHEPFGLGRP